LMPMVLGLNLDLINRDLTIGAPASQFWIQLSTVVAGGLAFSTVITLLLTPSLLWWQQSLSQRIQDRITQTARAASTSQAS